MQIIFDMFIPGLKVERILVLFPCFESALIEWIEKVMAYYSHQISAA
jgi:hypothetical protein